MNSAAPDIFNTFSPWTMAGVTGLLGSAWALSAWQKLGVGKELLWSAARATVQLGIMGFLLGWLFR